MVALEAGGQQRVVVHVGARWLSPVTPIGVWLRAALPPVLEVVPLASLARPARAAGPAPARWPCVRLNASKSAKVSEGWW